MKKHLIYWLAAVSVLAMGCQKELSFEGSNSPAKGSLQSDITGDCLPKTVNGVYVAAAALVPATNTITVQVNVVKTGSYVVYTDTVNGYFFRGTGTFTTLGANNVTLRGNGTPFAAGINNFVVNFDTTFCDIAVTVLPVGSGPAVFSLTGTPGTCTGAQVFGVYGLGIPLNTADSVRLSVNVTTIGTYSITTTPTGGMTFTGSGTFSATGVQNVILVGTPASIPTTLGANTIPVTAGTSNCSFVVTVVAGGAFVADCSSAVVNGTYQAGTPLNATNNTVDIDINVTALGPFTISTTATNGMIFSLSGTFTTLGTQTITLIGSGTPAAAGTFNIPMPGTTPCTFPVICDPAPTIDWKFNIGATVYQGSTFDVIFDNATFPPFTFVDYTGDNVAGDFFNFALIDITGGILATEQYSSTATITNAAAFYFSDAAATTIDLTADPSTPAVNMIFRVTSHNTATKTIIGTFSGTAFDAVTSTIKTITNGTFTAVYP